MVKILRDAGLSELVAGDEVERLAQGFQFTEGPLYCPDGSLIFQDIKAERTYRIGPDGSLSVLREQTGAANGQTFMPGGAIAFCEQNGRRVSRMSAAGTEVAPLVDSWSGARLNSPNDIVCRSDGLLYFTDPPYGVSPADRALHFQGVYLLELSGTVKAPAAGETTPGRPAPGPESRPEGRTPHLRVLADDFERPNGLAFSPAEDILYVCDTPRYHVRAFGVHSDGTLEVGSSRLFARVDPAQPGGPDGMKVDRDGRVYVAVAEGVWVFEPTGRLLGILALPARPSNLAWCGSDGRSLAITAVDAVYRVRLHAAGVLPPLMPVAADQ
jgi:gluconolactonase